MHSSGSGCFFQVPDARRFPSLNRTPLVTARHLRTTLLPPSESLCPLPSQASLVESKRVLVWKILRVQGKGPPPAPWLEQGVPCSKPVEDPSPSCTPGKATPQTQIPVIGPTMIHIRFTKAFDTHPSQTFPFRVQANK